jgi:TRAP-type C4-dicarboxylate transport system substrate-binding protein
MSARVFRSVRHVIWVTAVCLATACSGIGVGGDKSGGDTVVLRFATIDGMASGGDLSSSPETFATALSEVSGGRLKVHLDHSWGDGRPDAESDLVQALASGTDLDGGWPATRAFAAAGIDGLGAVEAPLVITNYEGAQELVSGSAAEQLLSALDGTGVKGLGLGLGPLRRPFAGEAPLLGPDDWSGVVFRVFNSPVQGATVTALGGTPENLSFAWRDKVREGGIRGGEFDANSTLGGGLHVTSNVVLWPKVLVFSLSQRRYDSLTRQQREWVSLAANRATLATLRAPHDSQAAVDRLCELGTTFSAANSEQVAALRARVKVVIDALAADPEEAALMSAVADIGERNPQVERLEPSSACQPVEALGAPPSQVSALPEGTYRVQNTLEDVQTAGLDNASGLTGVWTLEVASGSYDLRCRVEIDPHDCGNNDDTGPLELGDLRGSGDVVWFVARPDRMAAVTGCELPASNTIDGHCAANETYVLTWSLEGNQLTFGQPQGVAPNHQYLLRPWTKIR